MKVFIYATEGIYRGLHGISNQCVIEIDNLEEAKMTGEEMAEELVESFGLEDEYYEDFDENGYSDDYCIDPEFDYFIYKIRDDIALSTRELDEICAREDWESFVEKYCEKEELV